MFRLAHVEARAELDTKQFMRHVERGHYGDTLGAHDFPGLANLVHLAVEVSHRLHQCLALAVVTRDAIGAAQQVDFDCFGDFGHAARRQPGSLDSRPSSRALAPSIFSCSWRALVRATASSRLSSTFSARSRSHSDTNCATFASSELNSASTRPLCCKIQATSSSKGRFCMCFMTLRAPPRGSRRGVRRRPECEPYGAA